MKHKYILRIIVLVVCTSLVVVLWKFWSGLCNEGCPSTRALSMQFLSLAAPLALLYLSFTFTSAKPSLVQRLLAITLTALFTAWAFAVTWFK